MAPSAQTMLRSTSWRPRAASPYRWASPFPNNDYRSSRVAAKTTPLVLNTVPTGDVTVDITLPSGTDLSLDSTTLRFTTANWSTLRTITVSADEDDDATTDDPVQISHTISGGGYDNTAVPDVRVTITENDLFDAEATYRLLTRYGSPTEVELAEYLADGVTGVTFALESCDDTRSDYYDSAAVENGKLKLASNTLGHVHGENTRGETVCTVTATSVDGYEEREFRLYTVSDRTPTPLLVGDLTLAEARPTELDVQVALPEGAIAYVRLAWRKPGGQPIFRVVSGVTNETVLTIPGLVAGTEYEVRAYLMTFQSFDLYRVGNTGADGTLIPEGSPGRQVGDEPRQLRPRNESDYYNEDRLRDFRQHRRRRGVGRRWEYVVRCYLGPGEHRCCDCGLGDFGRHSGSAGGL